MSWCFATVNNKLAEVYFEEEKGKLKIFGHRLVKKSEYKTKKELKWIDKDTKRFKLTYKQGKYWRKDLKKDKLIRLETYSYKKHLTHYIIFGDSISFGEGDPKGGWVKKLNKKYSVDNLSVSGATTNDLVKNFPTIINQSTLIIALGVNDSIFIPLTQFKKNLVQIIKLAQKHTKNIVFVGPALVDQTKVDPIPWESDYSYINQTIEQFSQAIAGACIKKKLKFIDLFHQLPETYIQTLPDGVHPNHVGHQLIYDIIKNKL